MAKEINGIKLEEWIVRYPLLEKLIRYEPVFWENDKLLTTEKALSNLPLTIENIFDAKRRMERFAPLLKKLFPELEDSNGVISSELREILNFKKRVEELYKQKINGRIFLKMDSHLPIAGSIKARGGIYEVLKLAETIALEKKLISINDDYSILTEENCKNIFSAYTIAVGSTGNLGLSIGIISRALGFNAVIHMSSDAKEWKKNLLLEKGAKVIEYQSDYSIAVEEGRKKAKGDPFIYFVDDEQSIDLFLGYSLAAIELKQQLEEKNITLSKDSPLIVYLPCGVGGAPGGICFGLKNVFRDLVHCIFVEPTHSPSMFIGLMTNLHSNYHIREFGLDNKTEADGLAVGSPSRFVGKMMEHLLEGVFTIEDSSLFQLMAILFQEEKIAVEPSAAASLLGPLVSKKYQEAIHIVWATGGALVPNKLMNEFIRKGNSLLGG